MKKLLWLILPLMLLVVAGAWYLLGHTFEITIPKSIIVQEVQRQFPTVKSKGLLSVRIKNPVLDFQGSQNRLGVQADADLVFLGAVPVPGTLTADGTLEYIPQLGAFHFTGIQVKRFTFRGIPESQADQATGLLTSALLSSLGGLEIYRFDPGDTKANIAKMALRRVRVTNEGIVVTLSFWK